MISFDIHSAYLQFRELEMESKVLHIKVQQGLNIHLEVYTDVVCDSFITAEDFSLHFVGAAVSEEDAKVAQKVYRLVLIGQGKKLEGEVHVLAVSALDLGELTVKGGIHVVI